MMLLQFYLCFASTRILAGFQREQVCSLARTAFSDDEHIRDYFFFHASPRYAGGVPQGNSLRFPSGLCR
jgi:hypothetical protein